MKKIPLTQGKFALVDDNDYRWLMRWKWFAEKQGHQYYAGRNYYPNGRVSGLIRILMHREILGLKRGDGIQTDHINRNGLDNRRSNLRTCNVQQNNCNRPAIRGSRSRYKGVTWHKAKNRWSATIKVNKRSKFLGLFKNEIKAAKAYDVAAREYFGEFAYLNFPYREVAKGER